MLAAGDAADEPVFVPRSASAPEGDGCIIALVFRAATNTSELLILNTHEIAGEPAAVLKLPRRVPAGFHALSGTCAGCSGYRSGKRIARRDGTDH
jgi:carotenoid cleavage dioxygenase-like enzyme